MLRASRQGRRRSRAVALGTALAVGASVMSLTTGTPAAIAEPSRASQQDSLASAESLASAAAREQGTPVEVASQTTENSQVLANPDGTFSFVTSAQPVRVKRGDGWVPVDLTLRELADGSVAPVAAPVDLRLSGGGANQPLAVVGRDNREVGLSWPGSLPDPVLDGPTATYHEVLSDVDLVVRVTAPTWSSPTSPGGRLTTAGPT